MYLSKKADGINKISPCPIIIATKTDTISKTNKNDTSGKNITFKIKATGEIYPKYFNEIGNPAKNADIPTASEDESHFGIKENFAIKILISATMNPEAAYDSKNPAWNISNGINISVTSADNDSDDMPS